MSNGEANQLGATQPPLWRATDYGKRRIRSRSSDRFAGGAPREDWRLMRRKTAPNAQRASVPMMTRSIYDGCLMPHR
jgi:hypothetical protein